ncbi:MAG: histidine--tRNA ligase [Phycisphaerae bacterium]|jgi:histidyl-tRNA synthetase
MKFQAVKGTRDFYPDAMRVRNWITDAWRRVSLRNGFEEYDSPIFEYLDLFEAKSGPEISEQLFAFTDRGGRRLAILPEITPSLARMVNAKVNALPRPIKWFSIPRICRAENPQKGRLREFFQWNIDIIGEESPGADAECVLVAVEALRELGLTSDEVKVRYSSRALIAAVLKALAVGEEQVPKILSVLDKRSKVPAEAFNQMLRQAVPDESARRGILRFLDSKGTDVGKPSPQAEAALGELEQFQAAMKNFGIADWCQYDTGVVRGLAYYTGIVYEIFDAGQAMRAVAGGGRYDNLLEALGGPKIAATGFGMGDVVLGILLEEKGKIPKEFPGQRLDFFVIDADEGQVQAVLAVVAALRKGGLAADFSYKRQPLGKQLKEANRRSALRAAIVRGQTVTVKDLASGQQVDRPIDEFLAKPLG